MLRVDGSLARKLDFGESPAEVPDGPRVPLLRLALLRGPDKYKVLERRRRTAQIKARHALDLLDSLESTKDR